MWYLVLLLLAFYLLAGTVLSCFPCIAQRKRAHIGGWWWWWLVAVCVAWSAPFALWLLYSPLSVCSPRIVHSYPTNRTLESTWESFWCSFPCTGDRVARPATHAELRELLQSSSGPIRVVGGGHSTSSLQCAGGSGIIVTTDAFCHLGAVTDDGVATLGAGCSVRQAQELLLDKHARQLRGFGAITSQRLGGAISTSLHGQHTQSFTEHLVGLEAMLANGTVLRVTRDVDVSFDAWPASMGMLGVVLSIQLQTWPAEDAVCEKHEGAHWIPEMLSDTTILSFEARGVIRRNDNATLTSVRTCRVHVTTDATDTVVEDIDSIFGGFFADNILLDWAMYLGGIVPRIPGIDAVLVQSSPPDTTVPGRVVQTVNEFRNRVSFHPHFDEEYAVPRERCMDAVRALSECVDDNLPAYFYLRRVDATRGWLTWSAVDSCAIRIEFFRFTSDGVDVETRVRQCIEHRIAHEFRGAGHYGKPWYSSPSLLLRNSPNVSAFLAYRASVDPANRFQTPYTRMLLFNDTTEPAPITLSPELDTRLILWRVAVTIALLTCIAGCCSLCRQRRERRGVPVMVAMTHDMHSRTPPPPTRQRAIPHRERIEHRRRY